MLKIQLPIGAQATFREGVGWRSTDATAESALNALTATLRGVSFKGDDIRGGAESAGMQHMLKLELLNMPGIQLLEESEPFDYDPATHPGVCY